MAVVSLGLASTRNAHATTPRFTRLRPFRLRRPRRGPVGAASRAVGAIGALFLYAAAVAWAPAERALGLTDRRRRERATPWIADFPAGTPALARPALIALA